MKRDREIRRILAVSPTDALHERGVFRPARRPELVERPPGKSDLAPGEVLLTPEWLDEKALSEYFSEDPRLSDSLPGARVVRSDLEPQVLVFENVPEPTGAFGQVRRVNPRTWIMDSREVAGLRLPYKGYDVIVWGELGSVRVFQVRPRSP